MEDHRRGSPPFRPVVFAFSAHRFDDDDGDTTSVR